MASAPYELKDSGARQEFATGAKRDTQDGKPRFSLITPFGLERVAWIYTEGAKKYGDNNWQKGIPFSRYLDSAERHLMMFKQGRLDEDHIAQAVWNLLAIMHHQAVGPADLDDLPQYDLEYDHDLEGVYMDEPSLA